MRRLYYRQVVALLVLTGALVSPGHATKLEFVARELFRIPFGTAKSALGAKIDGTNFLVPRDFSLDPTGHFYVNDANKHRIVRLSPTGAYEMGIQYPSTAHQVFAQPDGLGNLWLMVSDPGRGFYYGVYDPKGKRLRDGVFAQYDHFRLYVDDAHILHVVLSSKKLPGQTFFYFLDQESFLLKKITVAKPPEEHHRINHLEKSYYIDPVPTGAMSDADQTMKITDAKRETVGTIKGRVVYVTDQNEIYTRTADCELTVYGAKGTFQGTIKLEGLPTACASARFDGQGNVYVLDGTPNAEGKYLPDMPGMRLTIWERR